MTHFNNLNRTSIHGLPNDHFNNQHNNNNHHDIYNNNNLATSFFSNQPTHNTGLGDSGVDSSGAGVLIGRGEPGASGGTLVGVVEYVPDEGSEGGPQIVAMDQRQTQNQEAYYLFFVGSTGMILNLLIVIIIFLRRPLRRMTSAFLVHASFLNFVKAAFCIPFGINLLSDYDDRDHNQPPDCVVQGSSFIVILTTSVFNMVAMICTEAYTFGEVNVGGNSQGTTCCILFGVLVVYITSVILHLGPTLIGGDIVYNPDIGSCAFKLGNVTGYVANVMCIIIITFALVGVGHFLNKFYKEIQMNRPNRVSMLVRHSISLTNDDERQKDSVCAVHEMTQEAIHRAKIFVICAVAFILCWYPLFILIIMDMHFAVSPKVYQAFCFIAWSHPLVEPVILIFFDRNLNILSRFMYCDHDQYTAAQIAYLLSQHRDRSRQQYQQSEHEHQHDEVEDLTTDCNAPAAALNSHNISMEIENAFQNVLLNGETAGASASPMGGGGGSGGTNSLTAPPAFQRHGSSPTSPHRIITSSPQTKSSTYSRSVSSSGAGGDNSVMTPVSTSSPRDLQGFQNFQPLAHGGRSRGGTEANSGGGRGGGSGGSGDDGLELNLTSMNQNKYEPVVLKDAADGNGSQQRNIQC